MNTSGKNMADIPEVNESVLDTSPERDEAMDSPTSLLINSKNEEDEGKGDSARMAVEDLFDEVSDLITKQSDGALGFDVDGNAEKMTETETEQLDTLKPVDESRGTVVNIRLDEMGNYLPPRSSASGSASSIIEDEDLAGAGDFGGPECENCDSESDSTDNDNILVLANFLIEENKNLRAQMGKTKRVLAYVMSKYRNSVTFLLNELDVYKRDYQKMVKALQEKGASHDLRLEMFQKNTLIEEMKQLMWEAARVDDQFANAYEEKLVALRYENQGLRKLVRIALDHGGHLLTYTDKSTQTISPVSDQVSKESSLADTPVIEELENNLDVFLSSLPSKDEDLDESFHTANSLTGSNNSLNKLIDEDDEQHSFEGSVGAGLLAGIGDQDKVEFNAEDVSSVLLDDK